MATEGYLREFELTYKKWEELDLEKVYRNELGTASFSDISPLLNLLLAKLAMVNDIKGNLGDSLIQQIVNSYNVIYDQLNALTKYDEAEFVNNKSSVREIVKAYNEEILNWWPQVAALLKENTVTEDYDNLVKELKNLSQKSEQDAKIIEDLKTKLTFDVETFEKRYNEQFQKAELINQQEIFSKQANEHKNRAWRWSVGIGISSLILAISLYVIFKSFCFESSCYSKIGKINYNSVCEDCNRVILYLEVAKALLYRLFLISFIVYVVNFCVRNYNACMHNYTVNSHKANSLSAALVLIDRVKTQEGNDNIMSQAANAIFSHQPTGYNNKDPENLSMGVIDKIVEKANIPKGET